MKVGDKAEVSRTFDKLEICDYSKLSGHRVTDDYVPEPLIGALFSFLLGVKLPGRGTKYMKQETSFIRRAVIGESLTATIEITALRPDKQLADLSTTCHRSDGQLVASGRALVFTGDVKLNSVQHG